MRSRHPLSLLFAASLVAVTGCGDDGTTAASAGPAVVGTEVAVVDNAFEPARLEVEAGETVTWTWEGDNPHDVVFDDFGSEVQTGGTYTYTFEEAGEFAYTCTIHANMDGTIVVVAP